MLPILPHLVCLGGERGFSKLVERTEEDSKPVMDQNYFKHALAKAILWRTAEKQFDTLDPGVYWLASLAHAVVWLAEKKGRRVGSNRMWTDRRPSPALRQAVKRFAKRLGNT